METAETQSWTVLRLLNWTREYFERAGIEDARLAAEVLLAHVLGWERIELYARYDRVPDETQRTTFRDLVKRAAKQEPVAYLVGHKEFYSLKFHVSPEVLIPRAETEQMVSEAVAHLRGLGRSGLMWDACTGSGCVAVAAAVQQPELLVLATDLSARAVAMAERNAAANGVSDRVRCRVADMVSKPADCADLHDFDVITANPPYVAQDEPVADTVRYEPAMALYGGKDGLDFLRVLISQAHGHLRPGGALITEFGYTQADAVRDLIDETGAYYEPDLLPDFQGIERIAIAIRRED